MHSQTQYLRLLNPQFTWEHAQRTNSCAELNDEQSTMMMSGEKLMA